VGTKVPMAHEGNVSEKPMMGMISKPMMRMFYPFSAGTLTCGKSLTTMLESIVPPYPNDSQ
jgi:hypothetical protein